MALRLTIDEGTDPIDGSEINAVRRRVVELLERTEDDLSDVELMGRGPEEFSEMSLWLDMGRLPSEMTGVGCREYTRLRAHNLVRRAMDDLQRVWRNSTPGGM